MACASKYINNHPGVREADPGSVLGGERKYDVLLKDDWHFAGLDGDAPYWNDYERRRTGFFDTVTEFKAARPTQYTAEQMAEKAPE